MATTNDSVFVVRESFGTYGMVGPPPYKQWDGLQKADEETRFTTLSRDGKYFAVGRASHVDIFKTEDGSQTCSIKHRMLSAQFSPQNRFLISWENPGKGTENFKIWSIDGEESKSSPKMVFSQQAPKQPEAQFSWNDRFYGRLSNDGRILFYSTDDFHKEVNRTSNEMKISTYSFSPGRGGGAKITDGSEDHFPYVCYIKGGKQQEPAYIRLYKYPGVSTLIRQRSSFQSDRVSIKWNRTGTAVLVITMTDVDKTGGSYYGKTSLEFLDVKGGGYKVQLDGFGEGQTDLHACQWSPNSLEYCVIVGKMPNTRAALFNLKGDIIFAFNKEVAARNDIYFNPQGNIVLICGLGNLPGTIDIWEVKDHWKCLVKFKTQNATQVEWLNDGTHFITATTAPRMQVDNGYKVWNYMGKAVFEWKAEKHLFGITSFAAHEQPRTFPDDELAKFVKTTEKVSQKGGETAPVYVPVHKRTGVIGAPMAAKPKPQTQQTAQGKPSGNASVDDSKDKELNKLRKKVKDIEKLKQDQQAGKKLEVNQQQKIDGLEGLLKQIKDLELEMS